MDFKSIEKKWQKKWEEAKIFEPEIKEKKFFINIPYPYLNGSPHIGAGYSWVRTDIYARFKRMQGYNVLFPQGFHATGEPLMGAIKRLKANDELQISTFKDFGASNEDIEKMKEDIKYAVDFWKSKWKEALKKFGMSIDWRRSFVTALLNPHYNKFVQWQYRKLKSLDLVRQGTHPVIWCPRDQSPTGDHDRLEGVGESPIDYIVFKFKLGKQILPAATLRPETIFGVTNMWVNPDEEYVIAEVDEEEWILSDSAIRKLEDQLKKIEVKEKIYGKDLIGKKVLNPVTKKQIPILPANFVNPENATGIVMSVPAHAPYDWAGLMDLKSNIKPITVIDVPEFKEFPAVEMIERLGIRDQNDKRLEDATKELYRREFYDGVISKKIKKYGGIKVSEAKEKLTKEFLKKNYAGIMWETTGKVVCRCTTLNHVKILKNQWFLAYSDKKWKKEVKSAFDKMTIYPEEVRPQFLNTVDWLRDKACTRKSGLGTPLPWDDSWIIETLSDSTIYMSYYTIAHLMKEFPIEEVNDKVFDYIFLGKGEAKDPRIEKMKKEFDYWYPVDIRTSGKDLIQNHLTFFVFHHTALFDKKNWPKGIGVNGYVNIEKEKMSKSKGNIIPLHDILNEFGADLVRLNLGTANEGVDDAEWSENNIISYRSKLDFISNVINDLDKYKNEKRIIDKYIISKVQHSIKSSLENYEKMNFRTAANESFFKIISELKWYLARGGYNKEIIEKVLTILLKLITPIVPHFSEEMWEELGNKKFISLERMPDYSEENVNMKIEAGEDVIRSIISDIEEIKKISGIDRPKKITIFVSPAWKYKVYEYYAQKVPMKDVIGKEEFKQIKKEIADYYSKLQKRGFVKDLLFTSSIEHEVFEDAKDFLEKQFTTKIEIVSAEKAKHPKASFAEPMKPGILIE